MKQFKTILGFELKNYLTNKIFAGVTLFLIIAMAALLFFPQIKSLFVSGSDDASPAQDRPIMLLAGAPEEDAEALQATFAAAFPGYQVQLGEADSARQAVTGGEAECAIVLDGLTAYSYYVNNLSLYDTTTASADSALQEYYQYKALLAGGLDEQQAQEILHVPIAHETVSLGKDQTQTFFYTYIMIFALYMVILLYGQMVASNVASEKSSRAMELLITSARPVSMMFGKVVSSCLAGLIQLVAVFGSALLFYTLNRASWEGNPIVASMFGMPADLFVYMLAFFVLGFLIYAFLFGAIGSTASKLEDINTSILPVTFLFVIALIVVVFSMSSGEIDTTVMRVCSFVPFTSPMAMFTRIAMGSVASWEIGLSIGILVVSVVVIGVLAAKIYRVGVLLYGTPPKLSAILKAIRRA